MTQLCLCVQVRYLLKDLMRDWSAEGAPERGQSYGWVTDALRRHLPSSGAASAAAPAAAADTSPAAASVSLDDAAEASAVGEATAPAGAVTAPAAAGTPKVDHGASQAHGRVTGSSTDECDTRHAEEPRAYVDGKAQQPARAGEPHNTPASNDSAAVPPGPASAAAQASPADDAAGGDAPRVLVPGCGLGRLVAECAALGYEAVGVEFSFYMLLALRCALFCTICMLCE